MKKILTYVLGLLIILLCDFLFFPTLLNLVARIINSPLLPALEQTFTLDWNWCLTGEPNVWNFTMAGQGLVLWIIIFFLYGFSGKKNKNRGNEHGSARGMTDEEFRKLFKKQVINNHDERNELPEDPITVETEENSSSDVFSKLDLEEVTDNDN